MQQHWIMAPAGPVPEDPFWGNTMRWNTPLPSAPQLDITTTVASPNPNQVILDGTRPAIDWRGATAVTVENTPSYPIGPGFGDIALPVKVKNMKKRNLKLTVVPIRWQESNRPVPLPSMAALASEFNRVFGWQLNIWLREADIVVANQKVKPYGWSNSYEHRMLNVSEANYKDLFQGETDPQADITLLLVDCVNMNDNGSPAPGFWNRPENSVTVAVGSETGSKETEEFIIYTSLHEFGHVMLGLGHPDQGGGLAPLPGTNRVERLMHSGKNLPPDFGYFGKRLVKNEWDKAEEWLSTRPNGDH